MPRKASKERKFMNQLMEPSLTVRGEKKLSLTNIMLMTDFSGASDLALRYALALARRYEANLFLTHVVDPASYQLADPPLADITYQRMRPAAAQSMDEILVSGE